MGNRNIIGIVAAALGRTFASNARLIAKASSGSAPEFFVREIVHGTNVDTAVSQLTFTPVEVVKNKTATTTTKYEIARVVLATTGKGDFDVEGFSTEIHGKLMYKGKVIDPDSVRTVTGTFAGTGHALDKNGVLQPAVFQGAFTAVAGQIEVN